MRSFNETSTPFSSSRSLTSSRRSIPISRVPMTWGFSRALRLRRSAIVFRVPVSSRDSVTVSPSVVSSSLATADASGPLASALLANASTSPSVIAPCGPVPSIRDKSTPSSSARCFARGVALTSSVADAASDSDSSSPSADAPSPLPADEPPPLSRYSSMSPSVTAPCGPVPSISARSTSASLARRLARGVALTSAVAAPPSASAPSTESVSGADAASPTSAGRSSLSPSSSSDSDGADSPSLPITASGFPTSIAISSPSSTYCSSTTPFVGASISALAFSDSRTATTSPFSTRSPVSASQATRSP